MRGNVKGRESTDQREGLTLSRPLRILLKVSEQLFTVNGFSRSKGDGVERCPVTSLFWRIVTAVTMASPRLWFQKLPSAAAVVFSHTHTHTVMLKAQDNLTEKDFVPESN